MGGISLSQFRILQNFNNYIYVLLNQIFYQEQIHQNIK